jgi:hypothetical protein
MNLLSPAKVFDLLETRNIQGSPKELNMLCLRVGELVELNGEAWVKENRQRLLDEWDYIVREGMIGGTNK